MSRPNNRRYPSANQQQTIPFLQEDEDDRRLNHLHSQVAALKAITIEIGNEAKEQNTFLDTMGLDFGTAGERMTGTLRSLKRLSETEQGRYYLFYTVLFFLAILLFLYFFIF